MTPRTPDTPSTPVDRTELRFTSHGVSCGAWHLRGQGRWFKKRDRRPCVVMAHGFGGTRDTGLLGYAEPIAAAGFDVFVFDYRCFGDSDGTPRQLVSCRMQRQDYHAAIDAAGRLPGVDPDRIALWGYSYAGGHSIAVAAQTQRVAGVVSVAPAVDGLATLALIAQSEGLTHLVRLTAHGIADLFAKATHRKPHTLPIAGQPGSDALITVSGAEEACLAVAGPTWRNETPARHALEVARNRPTRSAKRVSCPVFVQLGKADRVAPVTAALRMYERLGGPKVLAGYPIDHVDVFDRVWQRKLVADQIEFLAGTLR